MIIYGNLYSKEETTKPNYVKGDIPTALEENYLRMDELMLDKPGRDELILEYRKSKEESSKIKENTKNTQIESLRELIDPKEQPDARISMFTGCTANVLAIKDKKLYFANAGDSRCVLCKKGLSFCP